MLVDRRVLSSSDLFSHIAIYESSSGGAEHSWRWGLFFLVDAGSSAESFDAISYRLLYPEMRDCMSTGVGLLDRHVAK